jgi:GNAT superfamily N-acetyltransferase
MPEQQEPKVARSDDEIRACGRVMRELRPHVAEDAFVERVRSQERQGYRLAYLNDAAHPAAVAGFRILENLAWGRFLYVDDLVTRSDARSCGHGARLLRWLHRLARSEGCRELHLDSGVQRADAHRFYVREGMRLSSYHFGVELGREEPEA